MFVFHYDEQVDNLIVVMKENRIEDALKFSELYRRLMGQKKFSNKWGILYLLNSVCNENDEKVRFRLNC
jgi:hypothetical protein